jgi:transposase-like protein
LQGKALQVRKKKQVNKYPTAFRKMALERLKSCRNVTELAGELGIHRTQLYKWRDQMECAVKSLVGDCIDRKFAIRSKEPRTVSVAEPKID